MTPPTPNLLHAFDGSEWAYYVAGHDPDEVAQVDEPDDLEWEPLWMRPVAASHLDEFDYDGPAVTRAADGRFASVVVWIECPEGGPGAEPWMGVRYRRVGERSL